MRAAENIAFWCPAIVFGAVLIAWPLSVVYFMFLGSGAASGTALHIKNYILFTGQLYPVFYGSGVIFSRAAAVSRAHWAKVLILGCIPALSGLPWLLIWDLHMRFLK